MIRNLTSLFATATLALATPVSAAAPGTLTVSISGLHNTRGQLIVCLWREKPGFPSCAKSKSALRKLVPVSATDMQVSFPHVAPGECAVTVEHDEDGNGKLKHNFIGMPVEGVGVSNNPGGMPGFTKSLVPISGDTAIAIRMKYLFG